MDLLFPPIHKFEFYFDKYSLELNSLKIVEIIFLKEHSARRETNIDRSDINIRLKKQKHIYYIINILNSVSTTVNSI